MLMSSKILVRSGRWMGGLVALGSGLAAAEPGGGLSWTRTETTLAPPRMMPVVTTEFPFRNNGAEPVKIVGLVPLCDCLKATVAKTEFAPGEAGAIRVQVPVNMAAGRVAKAVRVMTDRGEPAVLRLVLQTPAVPPGVTPSPAVAAKGKSPDPLPLTMRSHLLTWKLGAAPTEQAIDLRVASGKGVRLTAVRSSDPRFSVRLVPTPVPGHHQIVVSPQSTAETVRATLRLDAFIEGQKRIYSARLVVE